MSPIDASPTSASPPSEPWAGKSRNAKAQARHRAKRKAYIEQLEQTVSKLQTALALSAEDVTNLPTAQMKMRELKEENDTLKAEIRKLQYQPSVAVASSSSSYAIPSRVPVQLHSPASSSEEHPPEPKRRKVSPTAMDDYLSRNLQTYLAPADPVVDSISVPHLNSAGARQMLHISAPTPMPPPHARYQQEIMTPQQSPADGSNVRQPRDTVFTWPPFSTNQDETSASTAPSSWSFPAQTNHHRQRSSSGSSSSSSSGPPYLTTHTPVQMPRAASYKQDPSIEHSASYDPIPKAEDRYHYAQASEVYALPSGLTMDTFDSVPSSSSSQNSTWSDRSWSYSAVRMQ